MALTFEEYKELRLSGLSAQQIKSMDEPNQRAMLRGYQRGQEAMRRSQTPPDALESTISAPPESEAMFSEEPSQMAMRDYWNAAMGSIPGSGGLIPATSLPSSGQIMGTGLALAPMIGTGMKIGGGVAALARGAGAGGLKTAVGGAVKEAAIEAVLNRLPPEVAITIRAAMGARRGARGVTGAGKAPTAAKAQLGLPPGAQAVPSPGNLVQEAVTHTPVPSFSTAAGAQTARTAAKAAGNPASEAGRALARKRWDKVKTKPKLEVVKGKSAGEQRIAKAKENPAEAFKPKHDVQYYSESKGQHINIEDMNQKHLEQAYRKLALKNPKPNSVAAKVMKAMLDEAKYRLLKTGIHIGQ